MILTLTPNPAFDRIQTVPGFGPGQVCRASSLKLSAGGKGVNVARAIHPLGGTALCTGFLGGHTGRLFAEMAEQDGIQAQWTWISGETRVSPVILCPETGETTVINEAGPTVTPQDGERLLADVHTAAARATMACVCGSLPPGLPPAFAGEIIRTLQAIRIPVFVDSSGETLRAAAQACPAVLKINSAEAAALLGWPEFQGTATAFQAARAIRASGVPRVVLTLGREGAILLGENGAWSATPPPLKVLSTIGSGDSFLAGLAVSIQKGLSDPEALRSAVASGSANALSTGGGVFPRQDYERILAGVTVNAIG